MKVFWLIGFTVVLVWSGINPKDQFTWFLEVIPALIGLVLLAMTYKRFQLTPMLYGFILLHCWILMVGGHYTYAEVPAFDWLRDAFDMERNNYDKVGHFAQGFIPALLAREILIRREVVKSIAWMNVFIVSICLAFSALYELIEWWVAVATGEGAEAFLGTQGYIWDTQSDMALALLGAICSIVLLARWHDRQLSRL
jgi:putative membrane protein